MQKSPRHFRFDEFTVLEVFLVVTLFGLIAGAVFSTMFPGIAVRGPVAAVIAPTADEYRTQASEIMTPFLAQATAMTAEDFGKADAALGELASKTQERMLRLRVPSDFRDAHLAAVLLLDRWKYALSGADRDPASVLAKTDEFMNDAPWLMGGAPAEHESEQAL